MPPKSRVQARYMRAVASGRIKSKGLSKRAALEYVQGYDTGNLPNKTKKTQKKTKSKRK